MKRPTTQSMTHNQFRTQILAPKKYGHPRLSLLTAMCSVTTGDVIGATLGTHHTMVFFERVGAKERFPFDAG